MTVTDADQERIVGLLLRDLHATIGTGHDQIPVENAIRLRLFIEETDRYIERVVEDTQQDIHDFFIDTDWPRCPRHRRHPLWLHDGAWWCEADGIRVAGLGELATILGSP